MTNATILRTPSAFLFAVLLASMPAMVFAQAPANPDHPVDQADVVVDGVVLFHVGGVTSFPAQGRADAIVQRIEQAAANPQIEPSAVRTQTDEGLLTIYAGPIRIMAVTDVDALVEHQSLPLVAKAIELRIREAIVEYRMARTHERLLAGALRVAAATVVLALVGATLLWLGRRLRRRISYEVSHRVQSVEIQSFQILRAERIRGTVLGLLKALVFLALIAVIVAWLVYVLRQFPWTRGAGDSLLANVIAPLRSLGRGFIQSIPDLLFLTVLFFLIRGALRMIRSFFLAVERGFVSLDNFEPEWAMPTYKIVRMALIALGLVIAYPYIPGSESPAFKGVTLFAGVIFSLGSSTAIANIIAGYMMTYRRAFHVGDRVKIGDVVGDVTAMRLQVTHLRTPKNEEVVIPNSQIINGQVLNYSTLAKETGLLLHTTVGIGYETPWRQVEAMLLEAAHRTQGLAGTPPPFVLQTALGDFAITYEINVACDDPHSMTQLYSALHRNILDVFNEYGVAIMTPAYVSDPPDAKMVPKEHWFAAPAKAESA